MTQASEHKAQAELAKAVCAVMEEVDYVGKGGTNTEQDYRYVSDADLAFALQPAMAKQGLALIPTGCRMTVAEHSKTARGKGQWRTDVVQRYTLIHTGGGRLDVETCGCGVDMQDKGAYKAMTGALKYALRQMFLIPTGDDAEKPGPAPTVDDAAALMSAMDRCDDVAEYRALRARAGAMKDRLDDQNRGTLIASVRKHDDRFRAKEGENDG